MRGNRGKGILIAPATLLKDIRYGGRVPGETSGGYGSGRIETFNAVISDQWSDHVGVNDGHTIYIPVSGIYNLYFQVNHPAYTAGVGFGNGWSGDGHGGCYLYSARYGFGPNSGWGTISDSGGPSPTPAVSWNGVACAAGDYFQAYTYGGATGTGVIDYNPVWQLTKVRG
jgi:hypothetical protein